MKEIEVTDIYQKYLKSHEYMNKKNLVKRTDRCWDMYVGNQWKNLQTGGEELPIMNMIQPIVKYKVSTIAQSAMTANFTDAETREEMNDIFKLLNKKFAQSWEKAKMDDVKWKMNKYSAVQGDTYALFWSKDTNDMPQILQNTSVLFGDENIQDIQKQPYIIIRERLSLSQVLEEAKKNGISEVEMQTITVDDDTTDQIQNKDEVSDKVTSYLYLDKDEEGTVRMCKSTKTCIYKPFSSFLSTDKDGVAGRLKSYPIVSLIWEPIPNSARGISEVEKLIPNQIELNKTLARRAVSVRMSAFPRLAYDKSAVTNPKDLMKVGAAIGIQGGGAQSINQMISYLSPANTSSDAQALFSDLLLQTKDLDGAGDMALGNINPERTSGEAITAIRDQTQIPLNEQVKINSQFVEDVANLWFDMWTTWDIEEFKQPAVSPLGEPVLDDFEQPVMARMSMADLEKLKPSVRVDVSEDNRWTRLSEQQALDGLLQQGHITFDEYVELAPENSVLPNGKLKKILDRRKAMQAEQQAMMEEQMAQQPPEQMPPEEQSPLPQ